VQSNTQIKTLTLVGYKKESYNLTMTNKRKEILRIGLPWGIGMFVLLTFLLPFINGQDITLKKILIAFPCWMVGGLLFGYAMNRWLPKEK